MDIKSKAWGFFAKEGVNHVGKGLMGAGAGCAGSAVVAAAFAGGGFVLPIGCLMVPVMVKAGADLFLLGLAFEILHEKAKRDEPEPASDASSEAARPI